VKFDFMPIFFQQDIDGDAKLGIWKIEEEEAFFLRSVVPQRAVSHPHKKLQHLAGRYLLKYLYPDFPVALIRVADTRKPYLEDEAFHFSISHCGEFAAAIVSRNERVGVDIELFSPKVDRIKHKFLHPSEMDMVPALREGHPDHLAFLTLLWSCKEAVYKWWSYGQVDFSEQIRLEAFEPGGKGRIRGAFIAPEKTTRLTLHYHLFPGLSLAWVKSRDTKDSD
jgi:4'-phosphopantetheinyl transferase EntD